MDDKQLLAVMGYVSTIEEKQKSIALQPSMTTVTVTATATEEATATATLNTTAEAANLTTTEGNHSGAQTTAEAANPTTTATVPLAPEDPTLIQLNKNTRAVTLFNIEF